MNRSPRFSRPPNLLGRWGERLVDQWRDDDGSTALEFVIVVPVVIAAMFLAIQVALYSYARSIALTAAEEGANAQRAYQAPAGAGTDKAQAFLNRAGDGLRETTIDVQAGAQDVRVTVTGLSLSVIPGFAGFTVRQSAGGPVERFVTMPAHPAPPAAPVAGLDVVFPLLWLGTAAPWRRRGLGADRERGSAALETVILAPPMLALIALAIVGMRIEVAGGAVENAAHDAARAASISRSAPAAQAAAQAAADRSLADQGLRCAAPPVVAVNTAGFATPVGQPANVYVSITCVVNLADVVSPGMPGSKVVTASFVSPIDQYRGRQG